MGLDNNTGSIASLRGGIDSLPVGIKRLIATTALAALAACGGGGDGNTDPIDSSPVPTTPAPATPAASSAVDQLTGVPKYSAILDITDPKQFQYQLSEETLKLLQSYGNKPITISYDSNRYALGANYDGMPANELNTLFGGMKNGGDLNGTVEFTIRIDGKVVAIQTITFEMPKSRTATEMLNYDSPGYTLYLTPLEQRIIRENPGEFKIISVSGDYTCRVSDDGKGIFCFYNIRNPAPEDLPKPGDKIHVVAQLNNNQNSPYTVDLTATLMEVQN